MSRVFLLAGWVALSLLSATEFSFAQAAPAAQAEQSLQTADEIGLEELFGPQPCRFPLDISSVRRQERESVTADGSDDPDDQPLSIRVHPLLNVQLRTDVAVRGSCVYFFEDPSPLLYEEILSYARNTLLEESRRMLEEILVDRRFEETLRQSIAYEMRKELLALHRENRDSVPEAAVSEDVGSDYGDNEFDVDATWTSIPPWPFPAPDTRRLLVGSVLFAGGGWLSASKNEWPIDEGYIGVGIAAVGLGLIFRELVPEWRGAKLGVSGANLSISW